MTASNFTLSRNGYGQLVLTARNDEVHVGVVPVRAFPIAAPGEGIALINAEGHEVGWADCLADLPPAIGQLIEEELASREFVPEIEKILDVSSFACPSTWQVVTNRGDATLLLKDRKSVV